MNSTQHTRTRHPDPSAAPASGPRARRLLGCLAVGAVLLGGCTGASSAGSAPPPTSASSAGSSVGDHLDEAMRGIIGFSGSVVVARGDQVLLSRGYGRADVARGTANGPTTRFDIGDLTEQLTGAAILQLQRQGRLSVEDPVCRYLPRCPVAWRPITIHHLLTHTSGLPNVGDLPEFETSLVTPTTPAEELSWVHGLPLKFTPGSNFRLSMTGYLVLGMVIEKVSGTTYPRFLSAAVLAPLGMVDTGYDSGDDGVAVGYTTGSRPAAVTDRSAGGAAFGLYSTAPDLLLWERGLVTGRLLGATATAAMTTPAFEDTDVHQFGFAYGTYASLGPGPRVLERYAGTGGFRSFLSHDMGTGVTVVVLANQEQTANLYEVGLLMEQTLRSTQQRREHPAAR